MPSSTLKSLIRISRIIVFSATLFISLGLKSQMRITEFMYSGASGEFVEFTNVGHVAINMTGWSFDDATRNPGAHDLSGFGAVQPGESVIVTETSPVSAFRSAWGLCAGIRIVGGYTNDNLGRSDEINLYDEANNLIDRLAFNDQMPGGGPRTQNKSAWVSEAGLGTNTAAQWTLSSANDSEGSFVSSGGDVGSPGKSKRATVLFDPCVVINGAPTIVMNTTATSDYIDGGISTSPTGSFAVSGVIDDPTDPVSSLGINFSIADDVTAAENLAFSVTSGNLSVVPLSNILVTGSGASRNVKIRPAAVGYCTVSISVSDGASTSVFSLNYAASAASDHPSDTRWHTGISDASDGIALDDRYFVTGDDELNVLNVYARDSSGLPLVSYNYTAFLNLPDPSKPEADLEAATTSLIKVDRTYWLGSMSNGKSPFENKPNRDRIFATDISGTGASTSFSFAGYAALKSALLVWGDANGYAFSASAAAGVDSKSLSGFAVEGAVFAPDSTTLFIGFRAPLVPTGSRLKAVIAPILQFEKWFNNGSASANPVIGAPIELNLGGRGIRDLIRLSNGTYIILAGSADETLNGALYKWTGKRTDAPMLVDTSKIATLNVEGALPVNTNHALSVSQLQLITDQGGDILYNDGIEAKSLGNNNYKKFRSDVVADINLQMLSVAISSPANGSTFDVGQTLSIQAHAMGGATRVAFFAGPNKVGEDTSAPFILTTPAEVAAGTYLVTARAYDAQGDSAVSDTVAITITACSGSGKISAEGFTDIPGTTMISLGSSAKYPNYPDVTAQLNKFEYGPNYGNNYGARVRGYICAPATGYYTFYISSDDQSQLFMSPDDNPQHISKIAGVDSRVAFRQWYVYSSQHSAPMRLVKGRRYYIETVHKQGSGADHLSVGWGLPDGTFQGPIPGNFLSPFMLLPEGQAQRLDFAAGISAAESAKEFTMTVSPNPTRNHFSLHMRSNSNRPVFIRVLDMMGQTIEVLHSASENDLQFGEAYKPGVYILEAMQNNQVIRTKLIKQ